MPNKYRAKDYYGRIVSEFLLSYTGAFTGLLNFLNNTSQKDVNHGAELMTNFTSAHFACFGGSHPSILYLLEQHGADIFVKDILGRRPLQVAANAGKKAILEFLVLRHNEKKIPLDEKDKLNRTIFHALCSYGSSEDEKAKDKELAVSLELLLNQFPEAQRKSLLESKDIYGFTPLDLAVYCGYTKTEGTDEDSELAKVFRKYGFAVEGVLISRDKITHNKSDFFGRTVLQVHAFAGKLDVVQNELANGAEPNFINIQSGRNALHLACGGISGPDHIKVIMNHPGTDIFALAAGNNSALHFAANSGRLDVMQTLFEGVTAIVENREVVRKFDSEHVNALDDQGRTPLIAAAMASSRPKDRAEVIKLLHSKGADFTILDNSGRTAYDIAKQQENSVVMQVIEELAPHSKNTTSTGLFFTMPDKTSVFKLLAATTITVGGFAAYAYSKQRNSLKF